jgi:hypothetical protein
VIVCDTRALWVQGNRRHWHWASARPCRSGGPSCVPPSSKVHRNSVRGCVCVRETERERERCQIGCDNSPMHCAICLCGIAWMCVCARVGMAAERRGGVGAAGLLRRDPRVVERKKYGRKKARKRFTWYGRPPTLTDTQSIRARVCVLVGGCTCTGGYSRAWCQTVTDVVCDGRARQGQALRRPWWGRMLGAWMGTAPAPFPHTRTRTHAPVHRARCTDRQPPPQRQRHPHHGRDGVPSAADLGGQ